MRGERLGMNAIQTAAFHCQVWHTKFFQPVENALSLMCNLKKKEEKEKGECFPKGPRYSQNWSKMLLLFIYFSIYCHTHLLNS